MSESRTTLAAEARLAALLAALPRALHGDLDLRPILPLDRPVLDAAVLVLLERGNGYRMVFTKRTEHVETHKGEVSFAGGMRDPGDTNARATALREAHEELGIESREVSILGELDPLVTVTGFRITPVVGAIDAGIAYRPNPREVERVLLVPMAHLRDPAQWFDDIRPWRGELHRLRSCRYGEDVIWGATSRMLQNFLAVVPPELL